jgi:hypothetical protein
VIAVYAAAYVILQWNITANVSANPSICFFLQSDGTTKANNFTYTVDIFPSITTIGENITYGLWNWDSGEHDAYIRVYSLTSPSNIASLNVTIWNATDTVSTNEWSSFGSLPTAWSTAFTCAASTQYAIRIEIACAAGASGSSTFVIDVKVVD